MRLVTLLLAGVLSISAVTRLSAQDASSTPSFFYQDGDMPAVFLGDSITEQKMYTTLIEAYTLTRYPAMKITFRNAGWSGDTAWLQKRGNFDAGLQRDVLSLNPKAVTIDFGMNDARGGDANYSKYLDYSTKLVKGLEKAGARVVLITPSPEEKYESDAPAGSHYNLMLKKYSDGLKLVSDNEKVPIIDQYTPFVGFIEAGRKAGILSTSDAPGGAPVVRLTNEGVHPNWGGHLIMATIILQGLHAPAEVSSVSLDAAGRSITACQGCTVEWQDSGSPDVIQFKRSDEALPWPLPEDPMIDTVLKIPGFDPATALNHYGLMVTGLKAPSYILSIDDKEIGTYSSADLAKGVNLGFVRQGPIYDQGQQLLKAVMAKNDDYFNRWRNVQVFQVPDWLESAQIAEATRTAALAKADTALANDQKTIESLRKPVPHVFKLTPATTVAK